MHAGSRRLFAFAASTALIVACGGAGGGATPGPTPTGPVPTATPTSAATAASCLGATPAPVTTPPPGPSPPPAAGLTVAGGLHIQAIANVGNPRELVSLPNGDVLIATTGSTIALLPFAESPTGALAAHTFATIGDGPDSGVAFSASLCTIFVGTQHGVYAIPYGYGDQTARSTPVLIASIRTGSPPAGSDGDVHTTTSVAYSDVTNLLDVAVGSSCNACAETDVTRASIFQMTATGGAMTKRATRIRNGIALTADPSSGHLWVGDAGQDDLPGTHPYEFVDDVTTHGGVADYGWPDCEENHVAYTSGAQCATTVAPLVEFPAYSTIVGAAFYPPQAGGLPYALPAQYRGGLFVTRHGSWHTPGGCNVVPEVDYVPMNGDVPATPVDWTDPTKQWQPFVTGFQPGCSSSTRIGRPTGIAVGASGTLFIADDQAGKIYRVRP